MVDDSRKRRMSAEWTPEDDLEPGGTFADGPRRTRVWIRAVALLVAIAFLLPLAISAIRLVLG